MDFAWMRQGACWGRDPLDMHPEYSQGRAITRTLIAKEVCSRCPVTALCLDYAVRNDITNGVYGGLTYEERLEWEASQG